MSSTTIALPKRLCKSNTASFSLMHTLTLVCVSIPLSPAPRQEDPPIMCDMESNASPFPSRHPSIYLSSWKQCAAETTQRSATSVPPQMWRPRTCRLACHGHSPSTEFSPSTILLRGAWSPQSEKSRSCRYFRGGREHDILCLPFLSYLNPAYLTSNPLPCPASRSFMCYAGQV